MSVLSQSQPDPTTSPSDFRTFFALYLRSPKTLLSGRRTSQRGRFYDTVFINNEIFAALKSAGIIDFTTSESGDLDVQVRSSGNPAEKPGKTAPFPPKSLFEKFRALAQVFKTGFQPVHLEAQTMVKPPEGLDLTAQI